MLFLYFQFLGKMLFYFDTLRVKIKTFTHIHAAMYFDTSAFDFSAALRSSNVTELLFLGYAAFHRCYSIQVRA